MMSLLLATTFVACESVFEEDFNGDVAAPQTNEEDGGIYSADFEVSTLNDGAFDLRNSSDDVALFQVDKVPAFTTADGATVSYTAKISFTEDLADAQASDLIVSGSTLSMSTAMLDDLVKTKYGIEPVTHDVYAQISANCVDANGTAIRLLSSTQMITVIPDMHLISDAYDLVLVDKDTISLNHSEKSVYEDPIFSVVVTTTEANSKVQFLSAEKSTFGVAADTDAAEGLIEQGATGAILLPTASTYRITINMETYTYQVEVADYPTAIYLIGDYTEWNPAGGAEFSHSEKDVFDDPVFELLFEIPEGSEGKNVKFATSQSRDGNDWSKVLGAEVDQTTDLSGKLFYDKGAINIVESGWHKFIVNVETMTYEIVKFDAPPVIYIPGNHQGWNPASAPQMLSPDMDMIYTNNIVMLNGGFKFTGQPDWSPTEYNYETFTSITGPFTKDSGSTNLVADPGTYQLVINLTDNTLTATSLSWSAIGSATPGGWATDTPLVMGDAGVYTATMTLTGGNEIKFRANNDWGINLGGDTDNLTEGGANIVVPEDGTYLITLDLSTTPFVVTMENQNG